MICVGDHNLHSHGYIFTENEAGSLRDVARIYTALFRNGHGPKLDPEEEQNYATLSFAQQSIKDIDDGKRYMSYDRFNALFEHVYGSVSEMLTQANDETIAYAARISSVPKEQLIGSLSLVNAIRTYDESVPITLKFIDDGLQTRIPPN